VFTALLIAYVSYTFGYRAIFVVAALLAIPVAISVFAIDSKQIDYAGSRGAKSDDDKPQTAGLGVLLSRRRIPIHLERSHAAATGRTACSRKSESRRSLMSACIIVTQIVITIPQHGSAAAPQTAAYSTR
jgi:hypothetical protein